MTLLTDEQAYAAMYHFLKQLYMRTKWDDVGALLGGMSMLKDGLPADPAVVDDWQQSVQYALKGGKPDFLELK
jgi:hypothetical protein